MKENENFLNGTEKPQTEPVVEKKTRKPRTKKEDVPLTETTETTEIAPVNEDFIQNEIKKFNLADATIAEWKDSYGKLTIAGIEDKETYEVVNNARAFIKKKRIEVEKVGKEMRSDALKFQKAIIAEEKRIVELIDPIETYLENEKRRIDEIKEQLKQEKEAKEQAILQERAVKLIAYGCSFTGHSYTLDDISISVLSVKSSDDFTWNALFAAVETKYKENQEIQAREEELRLAAEANNKKILEEALLKEEENKKKEADLAAREEVIRQAELKVKQEAEERIRQQELEEKRKIEAEVAAKEKAEQDKLKIRRSALFALGFSQRTDNMLTFHGIEYSDADLISCSTWDQVLEAVNVQVDKIKEKVLAERIAREKQIELEAEERARKAIEAERLKAELAAKEAKEKTEAEEKRIAAILPDVEKFTNYLKGLVNFPVPEVTSKEYSVYLMVVKESLKKCLGEMYNNRPQ